VKTIEFKVPIFITLLFFIAIQSSFGQYYTSKHLTRGADTSEIYNSCQWYADENYVTWNGIFHSNDNGQTLTLQRKSKWVDEAGTIFGDSLPGALFKIPFHSPDTIGVSFDYGKTFETKYFNDIYFTTAGCMAGELYISSWGLYRGIEYGNNFTFQSVSDSFLLQEVGTLPGELYSFKVPYPTGPLRLAFSNDYGHNFTTSFINFPGILTFDECTLHRGTQPGELYFVVRINPDTVALYHSPDYGQTQEFKSYIFLTGCEIWYTAGRTPGSFYYIKREICGMWDHSCIWIYFSRDYGATYTTYFHELDSTFTGISEEKNIGDFEVFPNPATNMVTFKSVGLSSGNDSQIITYDYLGNKVLEGILLKGQSEITLDIRTLSPGLYCYTVIQNLNRKTGKLVVVR